MSESAAHGLDAMTGGSSLDALPYEIGHAIGEVLEVLAVGIDLIGVAIIIFGFNVALIRLLRGLFMGAGVRTDLGDIGTARRILGAYILTGIEFMIASDIIHTVITREFADLLFVGLLVIIRTAISYFLGKELAELEEMQAHRAST